MKRVFGFQQKGSLLFLFISMLEVKSVENKQCLNSNLKYNSELLQVFSSFNYKLLPSIDSHKKMVLILATMMFIRSIGYDHIV